MREGKCEESAVSASVAKVELNMGDSIFFGKLRFAMSQVIVIEFRQWMKAIEFYRALSLSEMPLILSVIYRR